MVGWVDVGILALLFVILVRVEHVLEHVRAIDARTEPDDDDDEDDYD